MIKKESGRKPPQYIQFKRCGRKISESRQSEYCSNHCKNSSVIIKQLSSKLIKEIYGVVANEGLFSDEDIGMKLRSKKFKERFSEVLFIRDENEGNTNE